MNSKRPYKHILKNLFHEQATEIIPLLLPGYQVEQVLDVEMPDLKSTEIEGPPGELEQGLVGLALPEARVVNVYKTEWIEHSGNFERAYRVQHPETDKPTYLVIEFQTEREDEDLPRRLLRNYATVNRYAFKDVEREDMGSVGVGGGEVHARQQHRPTDRDGEAERHQQSARDEQLVIQGEPEQERSRGHVHDAHDDARVVPRSQSLDDQDLPDRAHCDARHQDPEAVGGVAVQGLGDGRHHLHERERDELSERSRQERPAQDPELPEEPRCFPEARSMGR